MRLMSDLSATWISSSVRSLRASGLNLSRPSASRNQACSMSPPRPRSTGPAANDTTGSRTSASALARRSHEKRAQLIEDVLKVAVLLWGKLPGCLLLHSSQQVDEEPGGPGVAA